MNQPLAPRRDSIRVRSQCAYLKLKGLGLVRKSKFYTYVLMPRPRLQLGTKIAILPLRLFFLRSKQLHGNFALALITAHLDLTAIIDYPFIS